MTRRFCDRCQRPVGLQPRSDLQMQRHERMTDIHFVDVKAVAELFATLDENQEFVVCDDCFGALKTAVDIWFTAIRFAARTA